MNDGSYVNMIIKNYNSEEVYSMEELEKSKQNQQTTRTKRFAAADTITITMSMMTGTKNTAAADTITITRNMVTSP